MADHSLTALVADLFKLPVGGRVVVHGLEDQLAALRVEQGHHPMPQASPVLQFVQDPAQRPLEVERMSQNLTDVEQRGQFEGDGTGGAVHVYGELHFSSRALRPANLNQAHSPRTLERSSVLVARH